MISLKIASLVKKIAFFCKKFEIVSLPFDNISCVEISFTSFCFEVRSNIENVRQRKFFFQKEAFIVVEKKLCFKYNMEKGTSNSSLRNDTRNCRSAFKKFNETVKKSGET